MSQLISIIVPCYNQAHYLDESLQSVLEQSYENWECIIINDGSPDDTEQVAQKWLQKDARFKYHSQENKGLAAARNAAIKISTGIYILPLDADDILHVDYLKSTVPVLEDTPAEIASTQTLFFKDNIENNVGGLQPTSGDLHNLLHVNQLVATSLYRKSSWERVTGYDESMKMGFEDWEFWLRLLKDGSTYHVVPEELFYYRKAKKSMLVNTIANHAIDVRKYIVQKHSDVYINDFHNYVTVCAHDLKVATDKLNRLENSMSFKIARAIRKPFQIIKKIGYS